jgi:predicted hotdog family 3-hydroxylacyl-ACP dehydratase
MNKKYSLQAINSPLPGQQSAVMMARVAQATDTAVLASTNSHTTSALPPQVDSSLPFALFTLLADNMVP